MEQLDHERLDVYRLALDFLVLANSIIEALPRAHSHLADQFTRASMFVQLHANHHGSAIEHAGASMDNLPATSGTGTGMGTGTFTGRRFRDRTY
jgi:hypothetical protein